MSWFIAGFVLFALLFGVGMFIQLVLWDREDDREQEELISRRLKRFAELDRSRDAKPPAEEKTE